MKFAFLLLFLIVPRLAWAADCRATLSNFIQNANERPSSPELEDLISHTSDILVGPRVPFSRNESLSLLFTKNIVQRVVGQELEKLGYTSEKDIQDFFILFSRKSDDEKIRFATLITENVETLIGPVATSLKKEESAEPMRLRAAELGLELRTYLDLTQTLETERAEEHLILKAAILKSLIDGKPEFLAQIASGETLQTRMKRLFTEPVMSRDRAAATYLNEVTENEGPKTLEEKLQVFISSGILAKALNGNLVNKETDFYGIWSYMTRLGQFPEAKETAIDQTVKYLERMINRPSPWFIDSKGLSSGLSRANELEVKLFEHFEMIKLLGEQRKVDYIDLRKLIAESLSSPSKNFVSEISGLRKSGFFKKSPAPKNKIYTIPFISFRSVFAKELSARSYDLGAFGTLERFPFHDLLMGISQNEIFFVLAQPLNSIYPRTAKRDSILFRFQFSKREQKRGQKSDLAGSEDYDTIVSRYGNTIFLSDGSYLHLAKSPAPGGQILTSRDLNSADMKIDQDGQLVPQ